MKYIKNISNKGHNFLFIAALTVVVVSCGQRQNNQEQTETPVKQPNQLEETIKDTSSTSSSNQSVPGQNDEEVMLNPPHGEPNHRCDIPVGSPLNSEASNTPSKATDETNRTAEEPKSGEKPSTNPPHGEPWHRCDIAVGSPLP